MKQKLCILSICLAMLMVVSITSGMTLNAYAKESQARLDANTEDMDMLLFVDEVFGTSASSINSLFTDCQSINQEVSPKLSNLSLNYDNNILKLKGTLIYDNKVIDLVTSGVLYKNEKTENAKTFENLILGDMNDFNNIHFVQLRVDKDKSCIIIILQMINTKQLLQFHIPIDSNMFDTLYNSQENQLRGTSLEEKIIELYSVGGNLIDKSASTNDDEFISPTVSTSTVHFNKSTYNGWTRLINDLNASGSIKLSNYSNINTSMFKGNGWKYDHNWESTPYSFASYSSPNGTGEYLTQFALLDIVKQSYSGTNDLWNTSMQAKYNDGMIVKYDSYSDTLSVLYYGFGLSLSNFSVGISGLTNKAVFINRSVNRIYETSGNIVRAAIAVYAPANTITSVFEHLMPYTNQSINSIEYFDSTYNEQYKRYNGNVIRGIVATTGSNRLSKSGHLVNVAGTFRYNTSKGSSWKYGFKYTCKHSL